MQGINDVALKMAEKMPVLLLCIDTKKNCKTGLVLLYVSQACVAIVLDHQIGLVFLYVSYACVAIVLAQFN